jgi:hypothetical protein
MCLWGAPRPHRGSARLIPAAATAAIRRAGRLEIPTPIRPATPIWCFVQFSDNCIKDATGVWLKAYVVDGIQYILSFADPNYTENVIINLSYGPTTGPHDGTAELEAALTALVAYYDGVHNKPKLDIFLPAGNSYLTNEHFVWTADNQHTEVEWIWRLPPDNTVLSFSEIWMNDACRQPCFRYAHLTERTSSAGIGKHRYQCHPANT